MQLVLAIVRQAELQRPGRCRPPPTREVQIAALQPPELSSTLFAGMCDYRIELTDFQMKRFVEVFDFIDVDKTGYVTVDELLVYVRSVGRDATRETIKYIFKGRKSAWRLPSQN